MVHPSWNPPSSRTIRESGLRQRLELADGGSVQWRDFVELQRRARSIAIIGFLELRPLRETIAGPSPGDVPERLPCAGRRESRRTPRAERGPDGSPSRR